MPTKTRNSSGTNTVRKETRVSTKKRTKKSEPEYSYNEYLKKFRPNPLPDHERKSVSIEESSNRLAKQARNRIREALDSAIKRP